MVPGQTEPAEPAGFEPSAVSGAVGALGWISWAGTDRPGPEDRTWVDQFRPAGSDGRVTGQMGRLKTLGPGATSQRLGHCRAGLCARDLTVQLS